MAIQTIHDQRGNYFTFEESELLGLESIPGLPGFSRARYVDGSKKIVKGETEELLSSLAAWSV